MWQKVCAANHELFSIANGKTTSFPMTNGVPFGELSKLSLSLTRPPV
jgi:hypothetical protein